jgi:mRNA interferase YafQ
VTLLQSITTKQFRKDLNHVQRAGYDLSKLDAMIMLLRQGKTLPPQARDHALQGKLRHYRACHVEPDWLLIYQRNPSALVLLLIRTGDHRRTLGIE